MKIKVGTDPDSQEALFYRVQAVVHMSTRIAQELIAVDIYHSM
jgi:hypothetical protein